VNSSSRTQVWFRLALWGMMTFALLMSLLSGADLLLTFGWGFSSKDFVAALVVLGGGLVITMIGEKIFKTFGGA
jgi:hypothetical protein